MADELGIKNFTLFSIPDFIKRVETKRKKQKVEARKLAALAFILVKTMGEKNIKKVDDLIPYFLTPLPEDPNKANKLKKQLKALNKIGEAAHARRRHRTS